MRWIVSCPAKVNLFLAVGKKDFRGYHPLRTVFQAISLADELHIQESDRNEVICVDDRVPENNTVSTTLRLLAEVIELPPLRVEIIKRIPTQSGLGGGSSDAAGLIRAAPHIAGFPIPEAEMFGLAQTVGADVPFFLVGGRAVAEGYGERLTPMPDLPTDWLVIVQPEDTCDTRSAFDRLDDQEFPWRAFPDEDVLYNDFERVAPCASLDWIERLQVHGARDASLTGSGSAVFGRFNSESHAAEACAKLLHEGAPFARVAHTLTRTESLVVPPPSSL